MIQRSQFFLPRWSLVVLMLAGLGTHPIRADLLGYWSANTTGGVGDQLPNDQGNQALNGSLVIATYSADKGGHTGLAGDYAIDFPGEGEDYAVIPATEVTFEEISITAWVRGLPTAPWAGLVVARDPVQAIGLDFHNFDGVLTYIWNNNSPDTWDFFSDVPVPEDEWTFVALTINPDEAWLYAGPKGGTLVSNVNEIPHVPQDNFTEWRFAEDDCCGGNRHFGGLMDDVSIWNEALSAADLAKLFAGTATPLTLRGAATPGDFDQNGSLDVADIDALTAAVIAQNHPANYDLNNDARVDQTDRTIWVEQLKKTYFGDADLDGTFTSSDFVIVFQTGEYEDAVAGNSTWRDGDWSGDGDFTSSDFVTAFQGGGFEAGPRPGIAAVPEPTSSGLWLISVAWAGARWRRRVPPGRIRTLIDAHLR